MRIIPALFYMAHGSARTNPCTASIFKKYARSPEEFFQTEESFDSSRLSPKTK
jgi:hypothetical protein